MDTPIEIDNPTFIEMPLRKKISAEIRFTLEKIFWYACHAILVYNGGRLESR